MPTSFDFEQPLIDLQEKISAIRQFERKHDLDMTYGVSELNTVYPKIKRKIFSMLSPWEKIQLTRHPQRPHPQEYVQEIFTDFLELHGDRRFADDRTLIGGFAKLERQPVMVLATQKGRNLKQNMEFNFGSALPEGYRKALRLMQLADKAQCPIITFIDTPGAYPGIGAEERHIGEAIAVNLREMFRLSVPVICVVTGEGGSGGALGIAVGNRVLMQEYAYYSVITPEGCAAILWRSNDAIPKAAEALHLTSGDLLELGVADEVVAEPNGGAHQDFPEAARLLKLSILQHLSELQKLTPEQLRDDRYNRFRRLGRFEE